MGQVASLLQPVGAIFGLGKSASVPNNSSAGLNTAGSAYNLNSNNQGAPLIQGGLSITTLLIVGGVILAGLYFWKK